MKAASIVWVVALKKMHNNSNNAPWIIVQHFKNENYFSKEVRRYSTINIFAVSYQLLYSKFCLVSYFLMHQEKKGIYICGFSFCTLSRLFVFVHQLDYRQTMYIYLRSTINGKTMDREITEYANRRELIQMRCLPIL